MNSNPHSQTFSSRYQFKSLLGEGGAGQVFTAWDKHLRRTVAIKQIKIDHLQGNDVRDIWQEAMCLASIRHSNIVTVYDLGIDGDTPYIVMEYIQGETLEHMVERNPLDFSTFIDVARQCLDGLAGAHHAGLAHRDLKPANIMLCRLPTGFYQVKILDFGIASFLQESDDEAEKSDGAISGSIHWISPEQIEGAAADDRSDIYSLGCVFYFSLTGFPPFSGKTKESILDAHLNHTIRHISEFRSDLPPALADWIMSLISRDKSQRPSRTTLALEEFEVITGRRQVSTRMVPMPRISLEPSETPVDGSTCSFDFHEGATTPPAPEPTIPTKSVEEKTPLPPEKNKWPLVAGFLLVAALIVGFFIWSSKSPPPNATPLATQATPILRLHGSNTVGSKLAPALVEGFLQQKGVSGIQIKQGPVPLERRIEFSKEAGSPPSSVEIHSHGSRTGFSSLTNGTCDLAMSSNPVRNEARQELIQRGRGDMRTPACEHVIGLDGLAVVVHPGNPISRLQKQQIAAVFSGAIRDWSELGREKSGAIHLYARDANSGTFDSFQSMVLGDQTLSGEAKRIEDSGELSAAVSIDPDGIGFVGLPYIKNCKALAVGDAECAPLIPTPFTIATEDYALSRRLYFYTPAESPQRWLLDLVEFTLGPDGQDIVSKTGFVKQSIEPFRINIPEEAPPEYVALSKGAERLSLSIRFNRDESQLDTKASRDLDRLVTALALPKFDKKEILLIGFADDSGDAPFDVRRSKKLAEIVSNELEMRGVKAKVVEGFGSVLPLSSNAAPDGRDKNRRVEVWIRQRE
jgi:phosphate transport system substrate-binding protein